MPTYGSIFFKMSYHTNRFWWGNNGLTLPKQCYVAPPPFWFCSIFSEPPMKRLSSVCGNFSPRVLSMCLIKDRDMVCFFSSVYALFMKCKSDYKPPPSVSLQPDHNWNANYFLIAIKPYPEYLTHILSPYEVESFSIGLRTGGDCTDIITSLEG